ncbi:PilW family protein [Thiovibrio frasassiensis]|uniref:PilW family protein n=1 Tax=Thiovibrio frasassiensis TaxID=2984131 RepID=A0A9X4MG16_9BACT|nr:PilW family protein [Thiovibrio frasassiensis]MDG4475728.1 PilW family protein [Thiovibrio frasassiensis]
MQNIQQKRTLALLSREGFTIVELMISLLIGGVIMAGVVSAFLAQHKSYLVQDDNVFMQENLRSAVEIMTRDLRMIGYDPDGLGAGITAAAANSLTFTREDDAAGALETITYSLYDAYGDNDNDLGRILNGGAQTPVAENIEVLDFVYLNGSGTVTAALGDIRTIQFALVVRAETPDQKYVDTNTYTNLQGTTILGPPGDNFRRRLYRSSVLCRNLRNL